MPLARMRTATGTEEVLIGRSYGVAAFDQTIAEPSPRGSTFERRDLRSVQCSRCLWRIARDDGEGRPPGVAEHGIEAAVELRGRQRGQQGKHHKAGSESDGARHEREGNPARDSRAFVSSYAVAAPD